MLFKSYQNRGGVKKIRFHDAQNTPKKAQQQDSSSVLRKEHRFGLLAPCHANLSRRLISA